MRVPRSSGPATKFVGLRLTSEELERLDTWRTEHGSPSRSHAVRALIGATGPVAGPRGLDLPVTLRSKLETLVDDGYARDVDGALTLVLTMGLDSLHRLHVEQWRELRKAARETSDRSRDRKRVDREGRGLLER